MDLTYEDLEEGIRRIRLAGRMDVEGSREIDLKLTSLTAARQAFVIIDLSLVDFLSSLGLGTLVRSAKAQMSRHGKVVLLSPQPHVAKVLETTQVDQILPVVYDFEAARRAVRPSENPSGLTPRPAALRGDHRMPEPLEPSSEERSRECRSFRNDDAELRPLSEWFRRFASDNGITGSRALDFELCLNELVTNVIHYAYEDRGQHEIRVTLERKGGELGATVEDDGRPFNPLEKEAPAVPLTLGDAGVGGWGIPIVRALADDLSYERRDGRNRFTIVSRERPLSANGSRPRRPKD